MIEIELSQEQLDWCEDHAKKIVEKYGGDKTKGSGSYNHNRVDSNLIGVKSEVATVVWLRENLKDVEVSPCFIDFENSRGKPDIAIKDSFIEVKGLRNSHWEKFKRCIPPRQLKQYLNKGAIVIWTTTEADSVTGEVTLKGWNYASDVDKHGEYRRTICDNIWLKEDSLMRNLESLLEELKK
tara:strand:- start:4481 stop:5026 length:546 start_codon:yes stop_codon:yes gene_type:complete